MKSSTLNPHLPYFQYIPYYRSVVYIETLNKLERVYVFNELTCSKGLAPPDDEAAIPTLPDLGAVAPTPAMTPAASAASAPEDRLLLPEPLPPPPPLPPMDAPPPPAEGSLSLRRCRRRDPLPPRFPKQQMMEHRKFDLFFESGK